MRPLKGHSLIIPLEWRKAKHKQSGVPRWTKLGHPFTGLWVLSSRQRMGYSLANHLSFTWALKAWQKTAWEATAGESAEF